jgi:DNA-binding PadR family transcriptional regulator
MRRGDLKYLILELLSEGARHGYDIITALEEKSGGRYRPSPGSVYPTLQLLEEGGYVTGEEREGKRIFQLTEAGRKYLSERPGAEWPAQRPGVEVWDAFWKLAGAVKQGAMMGDAELHTKLREVLNQARREVYRILAEQE